LTKELDELRDSTAEELEDSVKIHELDELEDLTDELDEMAKEELDGPTDELEDSVEELEDSTYSMHLSSTHLRLIPSLLLQILHDTPPRSLSQ